MEYRDRMRLISQTSRELRTFNRDVKELVDDKLKKMLRERRVNTQGPRAVLEERLLRSELRKTLPYEDVPWYPEYDEEGGQDMPFIEAGVLSELEEKARLQTKKKRGTKASRAEEVGEGEMASSSKEASLEKLTSSAIQTPTALPVTITTTTITVTTSSRPISHAAPFTGLSSVSQLLADTRVSPLPENYDLLSGDFSRGTMETQPSMRNNPPARAFTPAQSPRSTVLTPQVSGALPKDRRQRTLLAIIESEDEAEKRDHREPSRAETSELRTRRYKDYQEEQGELATAREVRKNHQERTRRKGAKIAKEIDKRENRSTMTRKKKKTKRISKRRVETSSESEDWDDADTESSSTEESDEDSERSSTESSTESNDRSDDRLSESVDSSEDDDERGYSRRRDEKEECDRRRKEQKERKRRQHRRAEKRRQKEVRATKVLDLLKKWDLKFTGEKKESPENFINRLDDCRQSNNVSSRDLWRALPGILDRSAGQWFRTIRDDIESWSQFRKAFRRKYVPELRKEDIWRELRARTQNRGEDILTYISNIKFIISHFREAPSQKHQVKIAKDNLLPEYRRYMLGKTVQNFASLEKYGRQLERQKELDQRNAPPPTKEKSKIPDSVFESPAKPAKVAAVTAKISGSSGEEEKRKDKSRPEMQRASKPKKKSTGDKSKQEDTAKVSAAAQIAPPTRTQQYAELRRPYSQVGREPATSSQAPEQRKEWQPRQTTFERQRPPSPRAQEFRQRAGQNWNQPTAFLGVCFNCQDVGHRAAECPRSTCFVCRQTGHRAAACPSRAYTNTREHCQVCGRAGYVFKNCPNCAQFRELVGNGVAGAQNSPLPPAARQ